MIPFKNSSKYPVTKAEMEQIYEKIKTPKKIGAVVKWEKNFTDGPTVFYKDGYFYMYFIAISKDTDVSGYETHLAKSSDLMNWEYQGVIFARNDLRHWDSKQCAGYVAFPDIRYDGTGELEQVNGNYYMSYLAGNSDGYEPDPLWMGLAKTSDSVNPGAFVRFETPILTPSDSDAREQEKRTLYKSFMFRDPLKTTGYPYVNAYNAKDNTNKERIFLAVSEDGEQWERYGDRPVLDLVSDNPKMIINGDPQIILMEDIYVMIFFCYEVGRPAYNTFACSRDLEHWTVWNGKPLVESEYDWENVHAHKTWFIRHNGVNYHFYCAVNDKAEGERFIALATS